MAKSQWIQVGADIVNNENDGFSVACSMDGSRIAIGAPHGLDLTGEITGDVKVFDWNGIDWVQVGADIDGVAYLDFTGGSVALSADGNRIAVGAPNNDAMTGGPAAGLVRIFDWNGSSWVQLGGGIEGAGGFDQFGLSVTLSADGSRVSFGRASGNGSKVFEWNGSSWVQMGSDIMFSGRDVDLSADGNRIAIGKSSISIVKTYEWNGSNWVQLGAEILGQAMDDSFGTSVSLSVNGNLLAVGAPDNDGNGVDAGHARIFEWNGSSWVQFGADIEGALADDHLGGVVAISEDGGLLAIRSGYDIQVFALNGSNWTQISSSIGGWNTLFGYSFALSEAGDFIVTGDPKPNPWDVSTVRVFNNTSVGINEASFHDGIIAYPNPTDGLLTIKVGKGYEDSQVTIFDTRGRVIQEKSFPQSELLQLNLKEPAGVYIMQVETGEKVTMIRLVIE